MTERGAAPVAARPSTPGYGWAPADGGEGLLSWSWAEERLVASHNYWLSTTRDDGRAHAAPVWGVWHADAFWFSTGGRSRKVLNLARDPRCVVTTEHADEAVIVEGYVAPSDAVAHTASEAYERKYGSAPPPPLLRVRPEVAFGFIEVEGRFTATATRWTFPGEAVP